MAREMKAAGDAVVGLRREYRKFLMRDECKINDNTGTLLNRKKQVHFRENGCEMESEYLIEDDDFYINCTKWEENRCFENVTSVLYFITNLSYIFQKNP